MGSHTRRVRGLRTRYLLPQLTAMKSRSPQFLGSRGLSDDDWVKLAPWSNDASTTG